MARRSFIRRVTENAGLHSESIMGTPVLELCGDDRVLIENFDTVISFDSCRIDVSMSFGVICLSGDGLILEYLGNDRILITGIIFSITVERKDERKI